VPLVDVILIGAVSWQNGPRAAEMIFMRVTSFALIAIVGWLHAAADDEPQTFYGKTVHGWIAVLRGKTSTEAERRQAALALGYFGAEAKAAVPDLTEFVRQGRFKAEASEALARIEPRVEENIPRLIEQFLKDGCEHLTGMGTFISDKTVRESLVRIGGPAVPALIEVLKGPDWKMRVCAAETLGRIGPVARDAVPSLLRAIEHPDTDPHAKILSHYAVQALGRIGPEAKAAVSTLSQLLDKEVGDDGYEAVIALDGIGTPPVRKLAERIVQDGDLSATDLLAWLGPKARGAIPALRGALADKRMQVRFSAAVALAHVEPAAKEAIPVLIEGLGHLGDQTLELSGIADALALFGPRGEAALPILIEIATKRDRDTDVLKALVQIDPGGKRCVPALIAALTDEDDAVADTAAKCLGLLGSRATDAASALSIALTCNRGDMAQQAVPGSSGSVDTPPTGTSRHGARGDGAHQRRG
jgi:HEAT repeat protein